MYMSRTRINIMICMQPNFLKKIDDYRGDVARSVIIRRALLFYMKQYPDTEGPGYKERKRFWTK